MDIVSIAIVAVIRWTGIGTSVSLVLVNVVATGVQRLLFTWSVPTASSMSTNKYSAKTYHSAYGVPKIPGKIKYTSQKMLSLVMSRCGTVTHTGFDSDFMDALSTCDISKRVSPKSSEPPVSRSWVIATAVGSGDFFSAEMGVASDGAAGCNGWKSTLF